MAGERNEHFFATIIALNASKSLFQVATFEELLYRCVNHWSLEAIFIFVLLRVGSFKFREILGDNLEKR